VQARRLDENSDQCFSLSLCRKSTPSFQHCWIPSPLKRRSSPRWHRASRSKPPSSHVMRYDCDAIPFIWLAELANVCWFQCHYTAESMDHSCLERGHKYTRQTAKKRVFQCTECRCYKVTFNARLPSEACSYVTRYFCSHLLNTAHPHPRANRKCQSRSYNLMSVYKEGRDFEARCVSARPEVLARGVEQPFVHPLQSLAK